MKRLEGNMVLVAGGSHGIGCVIAECFMDKGANAIVGDGRKFQPAAEQAGGFEFAKAMPVTENMLTSLSGNPPDAIICASGDLAQRAAEAVRAMGVKDRAKSIDFDAYPQILEVVRDDGIAGIMEQIPSKQIRTALRMAVEKARGEADIETVIVQPLMVTRENLGQAEQHSVIQ